VDKGDLLHFFDALIVMEWLNIQRLLASLAQKDVTQATVVRKLSSLARQNQTKKGFWELDNILRSIYIRDFIDDPKGCQCRSR
jgi:TnpA family transposase